MNGRELSREEFRYRAALDLCRRAAAANADPAVARTVAEGYVDQLAALLTPTTGTTEWACRWGCGDLTPASDEEWARRHAKTWHTTPMRRTCGPWEEA